MLPSSQQPSSSSSSYSVVTATTCFGHTTNNNNIILLLHRTWKHKPACITVTCCYMSTRDALSHSRGTQGVVSEWGTRGKCWDLWKDEKWGGAEIAAWFGDPLFILFIRSTSVTLTKSQRTIWTGHCGGAKGTDPRTEAAWASNGSTCFMANDIDGLLCKL
jgi:hypothetical protein